MAAFVFRRSETAEAWRILSNATSIATLLDRLTHHADIALIEGQSYRVREVK